ncbi:NADH-ubiquinone oxidoreductase B18 subunit-domain-containing protein [Kockovaella imperatae]|uniref:NADH dehydrogenase [ubiquinone] 1 beta subcomplex subunit 7 n=1 Tax=Kockovaella imperatae TaxID=4999 RepID=A0A1Y1U8B0_9TREE|nr:NADH-ubiquinone oxidoreductase B18 subunit-domain-containing protein [Kockovaella imperatae]ORX34253.1 NADH-ubiquinone oxidoreductase B18 subunit-domain-containing protein [Kockovaella imperatae]
MVSSNTASQEEMMINRVPLQWRDQCSALLIPLNKCRHRENYAPWKCEDERHTYEKCQYQDFLRRAKVLQKEKKAAALAGAEDE